MKEHLFGCLEPQSIAGPSLSSAHHPATVIPHVSLFKCLESYRSKPSSSALNHSDGPKFDRLLANSSVVAGVHNICHVFVRVGSLWTQTCVSRKHVENERPNSSLQCDDPPTSSITSLGEATLMEMPWSASLSSTSWKSKLRRAFARDKARPLKK